MFVYLSAFRCNLKKKIKGSGGGYTAKAIADSAHHMGLDPQNKEQIKVLRLLLVLITVLTKKLQQESVHPHWGLW